MKPGLDVISLLSEQAKCAVTYSADEERPLTDLGNAERFIRLNGERVRYCPQRKRWLLWDRCRWAWDDRGAVVQLAKQTVRGIYSEAARCKDDEQRKLIVKHARNSERAGAVLSLLKLAETEPAVVVIPRELDADAWLLNCANGTLNLQTGELHPHATRDLITKMVPFPYRPEARSDLWDGALRDMTGGDTDLASFLQRIAGYALTGLATERAFFFIHGPPGTAKSTFLDALHGALGDYALTAAADTWLAQNSIGGNRGDLVRLAGARLVTSSEVRAGAKWDSALIKRITGGDTVVAAAKYESEVEFRPSFTLIVAANDAPTLRDDDTGMWSRMRRVPFVAQIPAERRDRVLKAMLQTPEHAAAILAWAVKGCEMWQREGLGGCEAVDRSTAEYRQDMDVFAAFVEECCVLEVGAWVSRGEFSRRYAEWSRDSGIRQPLRRSEIQVRLEKLGGGTRIVQGDRRWTGVRLLRPTE